MASTQEPEGWTDHPIEAAVNAVSATNKSSVTAPHARPRAENSTARIARQAPTAVIEISTHVLGPRSVPPPVTNDTAPRATAQSSPSAPSAVTPCAIDEVHAVARERREEVTRVDMACRG